jgi:zinc protease
VRRLVVVLLLAGCATAPAPQPRAVETRPEPGLEATPTRTAPAARQLPPGLVVDPARLPVAPLEIAVRAPEVVTLPNGLSVYLLEDHTTPLVQLRYLTATGSVDDPATKLGLASLAASLVKEGGAGALGPEALDELLEFHGANASGGAGDETSSVTFSVRAADLARLFPVFADVVQRPRFDAKRFEVAVARLLEAIRRREDRPDGVAARALAKAVFGPGSLLGREATAATVKAVTLDDVKRYHAATWGAKGSRLLITGDFDPGAVRALLGLHFAGWKGGVAPAHRFEPAPALVRRVIVVPRDVAQAKVRLGAAGFTRTSPDEFPARLVNTALGAFGVGRLYREIRDERGLAYSAFSSVSPGPTSGLFMAGFDTRPEQVGEALEVALRILSEAGGAAPVTQAELAVASDMALNAFAFRFDGAAKVAGEKATFDLFGYPPDYLQSWRSKVGAVTPEAATALARRFGEGLQIVVVGPPAKLGDLSRFGPVSTITDVEQFR